MYFHRGEQHNIPLTFNQSPKNNGNYLPKNTVSYSRRLFFTSSYWRARVDQATAWPWFESRQVKLFFLRYKAFDQFWAQAASYLEGIMGRSLYGKSARM
jgi:hypothetical protein